MKVYDFLWHAFCDWYLEIVKARLYEPVSARDKKAAQTVLAGVFNKILHLLHPFVPFITEELWHELMSVVARNKINVGEVIVSKCLMHDAWPCADKKQEDSGTEDTMSILQDVIRAIRNIRSKMNIKEKQKLDAVISISKDCKYDLASHAEFLKRMAYLGRIEIGKDLAKPSKNSACEVIGQIQAYVPLEGIIDPAAEKERQLKHLKQLEDHLAIVRRKLENKNFVARAPAQVVAMEQEREKELLGQIEKVKVVLSDLDG
jgi:valyl-tRNA synthetase